MTELEKQLAASLELVDARKLRAAAEKDRDFWQSKYADERIQNAQLESGNEKLRAQVFELHALTDRDIGTIMQLRAVVTELQRQNEALIASNEKLLKQAGALLGDEQRARGLRVIEELIAEVK
jgi:hypothetical protein